MWTLSRFFGGRVEDQSETKYYNLFQTVMLQDRKYCGLCTSTWTHVKLNKVMYILSTYRATYI